MTSMHGYCTLLCSSNPWMCHSRMHGCVTLACMQIGALALCMDASPPHVCLQIGRAGVKVDDLKRHFGRAVEAVNKHLPRRGPRGQQRALAAAAMASPSVAQDVTVPSQQQKRFGWF